MDASRAAAAKPWTRPFWPEPPPDLAAARVNYDPPADELMVRFPPVERRRAVVSPIGTPEVDYASVQVDFLLHVAVERHPHWRRLSEPAPPPEAVAALVADVRALFARYWTPAPDHRR